MAGLTVSEPTRVRAVVVGIEHYPRATGWDLVGACGDAVRFARWLRQRGVPAANVTLLLAAAPDSYAALNRAAADIGLEPTYVSSRDRIMDHFMPRGAAPEGDVLYVYWGGHGVLDHGNRRLLLCPDASDADQRCIELTNLQEYLTGPEVACFPQQVFLVDVCAGFIEHRRRGDTPGPAQAVFPVGRREPVTQFALLAAAAGQLAGHGTIVAGSGDFSTVVTGWLEEHSPELDPDLPALVEHVKEQFTAEEGRSRGRSQTPVTLLVQPLGGSAEVITPARAARPKPPRTAARSGNGLRAGALAGGGVLALVAMVAIVAMFLSHKKQTEQPDQAAPAGAPATSGKEALAAPPPSPSSSGSPSPSAPTGTTAAPQKAAASPSASTAGPVCGGGNLTNNVPGVTETVCYVKNGNRFTMMALVKSTVPANVTVNLWLVGPNGTLVFPAREPKTWSIWVDNKEQTFTESIDIPLTRGTYEVHITTRAGAGSVHNAKAEPVRGHSMPFTY
ncbi:caspase family protein [Streptomyces sp. NPDC127110]|uniref:caspase family protein n=1 Tax=Streptomyces sp. NPDC127110 TaxID=3345362 RepID=UPI003632EB5F